MVSHRLAAGWHEDPTDRPIVQGAARLARTAGLGPVEIAECIGCARSTITDVPNAVDLGGGPGVDGVVEE